MKIIGEEQSILFARWLDAASTAIRMLSMSLKSFTISSTFLLLSMAIEHATNSLPRRDPVTDPDHAGDVVSLSWLEKPHSSPGITRGGGVGGELAISA